MTTVHDSKLAARFWAKVNKTEECWFWTAAINPGGYGVFGIGGHGTTLAHRMAYTLTTGPIPEGMQIDHRCYNTACVNPAHLRLATNKQNAENRRWDRRNTSGVRGVRYDKNSRMWTATVGHNQKRHQYYFRSREEAEAKVIELRNELFTHNDADRSAS